MNAEQVRALVAAKYPTANNSPLAQLFGSVVASDEAARAIGFAQLQAKASKAAMVLAAFKHAVDCIDACKAQGVDYDEETLSHNIEGHFPDLTIDECDDVAAMALNKYAATVKP